MEQVKMLTLFGKEPKKMNRTEIRRELRVQKALLRNVKRAKKISEYKHEKKAFDIDAAEREIAEVRKKYESWQITLNEYRQRLRTINANIAHANGREDVIAFYDLYIRHLEALIAELEFYKDRRQEAMTGNETQIQRYQHRQEYKLRDAKMRSDATKVWQHNKMMEREGIGVSWSRDKFLSVASDRGYQTEASVISAIEKELGVDRAVANVMLTKGKFTWGQVMCLGALMQMTPKEFCDVFLASYFEDMFGEYRASYANIDKSRLLGNRIMLPKMEEVIVGADGKAEDEEVWFD